MARTKAACACGIFLVAVASVAQHAAAACPNKADPHGTWIGSTQVGEAYTLVCNPGYFIIVGVNHSVENLPNQTITCPEDNEWDQNPTCEDIDDCQNLVHGCGVYGVCVDLPGGYRCECERAIPLIKMHDGTGEWVCGRTTGKVCDGSTCGAHGVCIDMKGKDDKMATGNTSYRCSCAQGYYDNNVTCVPVDCGGVDDLFGEWEGESSYGGLYTLRCHSDSLVLDTFYRTVSMTCPASGVWPTMPRCMNAWQEAMDAGFQTFRFWFAVACSAACVFCGALAAGLTMGLVSLSGFDMELLLSTKHEDCTPEEQEQCEKDQGAARRVKPLLKDHHLLLVTLLLLNSVANEALPIFLDQIVPSYLAVLLSVTCVLFFGEILPSAVFTGPSQLTIAAAFSPVVRCLQAILFPAAFPIKIVLDRCVGHGDHGPKYTRAQLKALLSLHSTTGGASATEHGHEGDHPCIMALDAIMGGKKEVASDDSENDDLSEGAGQMGRIPLKPFSVKVLNTDSNERNVEDGHGGGAHHDHHGEEHTLLSGLECGLAQRSLDLSRRLVGDLELASEGPAGGAPETVREDASVAEVLEKLSRRPPGHRCAVLRADGSVKAVVTREAILWAALMGPGDHGAL